MMMKCLFIRVAQQMDLTFEYNFWTAQLSSLQIIILVRTAQWALIIKL